jgi:hypothetical protein
MQSPVIPVVNLTRRRRLQLEAFLMQLRLSQQKLTLRSANEALIELCAWPQLSLSKCNYGAP